MKFKTSGTFTLKMTPEGGDFVKSFQKIKIKKRKDKRRKPRWLQHLIANLLGYFWLPCPICGENFGGHEWTSGSVLRKSPTKTVGVCDNCTKRAKNPDKYFGPLKFAGTKVYIEK